MKSSELEHPDPKKELGTKRWGNWPKQSERLKAESLTFEGSPCAKLGSKLEIALAQQLDLAGIPYQREIMPIPGRKYRFDFAIKGTLIECQGQIWGIGGHTSGTGMTRDCEKTILAQLEGWRVFPVTSEQIKSGQALSWIKQALHTGR